MNSTHYEEHKTQLSNFFRNIGGEVDDTINAYEVGLTSFFASLSPAVDIATRAQAELDRIAATRFSVFGYFRERETDLSRIFADLLNPSGSHGQGDSFLRLFMAELTRQGNEWSNKLRGVLPNVSLEGCKPHLEFLTKEGRRIDIVLEIPHEGENAFCIGIENKPWAKAHKEQIANYLKDLLEECDENALLLYFSGNGSEPDDKAYGKLDNERRSRCLTVPYRQSNSDSLSLESWIQQCREQCEAERVRWFLKDLLEYIRNQFENTVHTEPETEENRA